MMKEVNNTQFWRNYIYTHLCTSDYSKCISQWIFNECHYGLSLPQ